MVFSALEVLKGLIIRLVLYSWLYIIVIWARLYNPKDIFEERFILFSAVGIVSVSILLVVKGYDAMLVKTLLRNKYKKIALIVGLVFIWLLILYAWYSDIDGFQDLEESFLYYEPLLFILTMPVSALLLLAKEVIWSALDLAQSSGSLMSIEEAKTHVVGVWFRYFMLFWVQWYVLWKWLISKKIGSSRDTH